MAPSNNKISQRWSNHPRGIRLAAKTLAFFVVLLYLIQLHVFYIFTETTPGDKLDEHRGQMPAIEYDRNIQFIKPTKFMVHHTIQTRFMIGQGNQTLLAQARLKLFETFCLPTMQHQTSQNFDWLILADARLDASVLQEMKGLLSSMNNAYLVLTTNTSWAGDGVGVANVTSYGVELQEIAEMYRNNQLQVLTGNLQKLAMFDLKQEPDNSRLVVLQLDTLLDADDGLHRQAIEKMQEMAVRYATQQRDVMKRQYGVTRLTLENTWWNFCGTDHIEWHNQKIFLMGRTEYQENGIDSGLAGLREHPEFCSSAGTTRVGSMTTPITGTQFPMNASHNHAAVLVVNPPCGSGTIAHCWKREFPHLPLVLRSRTVTSDSMEQLNRWYKDDFREHRWEGKGENPLLVNETEKYWKVLETDFFIDREQARKMSMFLFEHVDAIVQENLEARCIPGFPCTTEALTNMQRILSSGQYHRVPPESKKTNTNKKKKPTP